MFCKRVNGKSQFKYFILILLLIIIAALFSGSIFLARGVENNKTAFVNTDAIRLVEKYFNMKIPQDTQRVSTCLSYDSSRSTWGVYIIIKEKDLAELFNFNEWDHYSNKIGHYNDFPLTIDSRAVIWSSTVKWWNPNILNVKSIYTRKENKFSAKLLIENPSNDWIRIFAVIQAYGPDIPSSVSKLFSDGHESDLLVGKEYEIASQNSQNNDTKPELQFYDSHVIIDMLEKCCGISFHNNLLSAVLVMEERQPGETVFISKITVKAQETSAFMEYFIYEGETIRDVFEKYKKTNDLRKEIEFIQIPSWYLEAIRDGWTLKQKYIVFPSSEYDVFIDNINIATSSSNETIIYINGRMLKKNGE